VAQLIEELQVARVRDNLAQVRERVALAARRSGRCADAVEILAAVKYLSTAALPALARAGVTVVGENRAQALEEKAVDHPGLFEWDFIGQLQSRRLRQILPHVQRIHSVASESALSALERHCHLARPGLSIFIEVNVAREAGKGGIAAGDLQRYLERTSVPVMGLMTMPPAAARPEDSRRWFAALRDLAAAHELGELSMGTTQDYAVAVEEGATVVRIGSALYA